MKDFEDNVATLNHAIGISDDYEDGLQVNLKTSGYDNVKKVVKYAKQYKIPVIKNPNLVDILMNVPTDEPMPSELLPALEMVVEMIERS